MTGPSTDCDVVVIGGGFAGLAAAREAANAGARVVLLEAKAAIGVRLHTTGIYVDEAFEADPPPAETLRKVEKVRLYGPNRKARDLAQAGYAFYTTDTQAVLESMAARARAAGADIVVEAPLQAGFQNNGRVEIVAGGKVYSTLFLIGADGARSPTSEIFGLGRNTHYLAGAERHFAHYGRMDPQFLHVFLDPGMAPGYVAWAAATPHGAQVGLAVSQHRKPIIEAALQEAQDRFGLRTEDAQEWRAGLIPCGGMVKPWYAGNVALVGDAAGMVSPLTAGGIRTALVYGAKMGRAAGLLTRRKGPPVPYAMYGDLPHFGVRHALRWAMDRPPPRWAMQAPVNAAPASVLMKRMFFTRAR